MKPLTVKQVARLLGACPKTLQTVWVRRGILTPLPGTVGQGRTMLFDPAAVQAFKENADLAGFLALCRVGWVAGNQSDLDRAALYFRKWKTRAGKPAFKPWTDFRGPYRPAAQHQEWALKVCKLLARREVETLCAVYIASAVKPPPPYLFDKAPPRNERTSEYRHHEAAAYFMIHDAPAIAAKRQSLSGADLEAFDAGLHYFIHRETGNNIDGPLRQFCERWFPQEPGMFRRLCAWVRMESHRKPGNVPPHKLGAAVGRVMGLQRAQARALMVSMWGKVYRAGVRVLEA